MSKKARGSRSFAEIKPELLEELNAGRAESRTLAEGLAIDHAQLLQAAVPDFPVQSLAIVKEMAEAGITRRMEAIGALLLQHLGIEGLPRLAEHPSDTVRGWACHVIGLAPKLKLKARLQLLRPLADDPHFGVREWAWMPLRSHIGRNVTHAISALEPWVQEESPYLRRFAVEATRPRGVWTAHLAQLKQAPDLGLPLLTPLRADLEVYVQDSVSNWLNDAAKSNPEWVTQLCQSWMNERNHPATARICARAMRSLRAR